MNKLTVFFLLLAATAYPATYYVDQTAGSDSNPGTEGSPWKNVPGMHGASDGNNNTLSAGDIVYMDRSDTWSVVSSSSSSADDGSGGLWLTPGVRYDGLTWNPEGIASPDTAGPGGRKLRAKLLLSGHTEAGIVRITRDHSTIQTYVYGIEGDGNAAGEGDDGYYASMIDINFRSRRTGGELVGAAKVFDDCYFHDTDAQDGSIYNYGVAVRSTNDTNKIANIWFINSEFENPGRDNLAFYPENGGTISGVIVRGCVIHGEINDSGYNEGSGIGSKGKIQDFLYEYNFIYDIRSSPLYFSSNTGDGADDYSWGTVRYNIAMRSQSSARPTSRGIIRIISGQKDIDFYGNILIDDEDVESGNGEYGFDFSGTGSVWSGGAVNVYNNTFAGSRYYGANKSGNINVKNNIAWHEFSPIAGTSGQTVSDNYTSTSGTSPFKNYGNLPTGFTGTYPAQVPNTDGLSIVSPNASIIDAGATLGSPFNGSINNVTRSSGNYDIGAYEYGTEETDEDAPTPDPMTFSLVPAEVDHDSISMTASTATDAGGATPVEYYFDETSGETGGSDSGWQESTSYTDSGLEPETQYTYRVKARDSLGNETAYSSGASATTDAAPDLDPPTPDPATFSSAPAADDHDSISMTATTGTDVTGPIEYRFVETTGNTGGTSSNWQTGTSYTDNDLMPSNQYTYTVQMRDPAGNTGTASSGSSATTDPAPVPPPSTGPTSPNFLSSGYSK